MTQHGNVVTIEMNNTSQIDETLTSQSNDVINLKQTAIIEYYLDDKQINRLDDANAHHQQTLSDVEEETMNIDSMTNNDLQRCQLQTQTID